MKRGDPVRITIKAGAVCQGQVGRAPKFVGEVNPGQLGLYVSPYPGNLGDLEDWHIVSVGAWDVPVHRSMFELVTTRA